MLHPSTRAKIDRWVDEAPELRRVESIPLSNDVWETRAFEDGAVVFEQVEVDTDEPVLFSFGAWCEQHLRHPAVIPRPLAKTAGPSSDESALPRVAAKR